MIRAHAALSAKGRLKPFEHDPGPIGHNQVDIRVTDCGICHTDAAAVDNDLGFSQYPLVPGHEAGTKVRSPRTCGSTTGGSPFRCRTRSSPRMPDR